MTYQGARAQAAELESKRFFSVSKIHLNPEGWATHVLWREVNARSNGNVSAPVVVPVADVVDAIFDGAHVSAMLLPAHARLPELMFEVVQRTDGSEAIVLVKQANPGVAGVPDVRDIAALDMEMDMDMAPVAKPAVVPHIQRPKTFAVSRVRLDEDGRVTDVLWGRVDTEKNAWAQAESIAPVKAVVAALKAGAQVFALFPDIHGHLPDRQFVQADYNGRRRTIVLAGPTAYEREIHDMDRIAPADSHHARRH